MKIEGNTRLIDMTLAKLFAVLDERDAERERTAQKRQSLPSVVYGLNGLPPFEVDSGAYSAKRQNQCSRDTRIGAETGN